jgi:hypothetical protein
MTRTTGTTGQAATERHLRRLLALACGVSGLARITGLPATRLHAVALDAADRVLAAGAQDEQTLTPFVVRLTPLGGTDGTFRNGLGGSA